MRYISTKKSLHEINAEATIIFVVKQNLKHHWIEDKKTLKNLDFKDGSVVLLPESMNVYVACESVESEELRLAAARAYEKLKQTNCKSAKIGIYIDKCPYASIKALIEGFELSSYNFDRFKSKKTPQKLKTLYVSLEEVNKKGVDFQTLKQAVKDGKILADSTNLAKDVINTPPEDFTPIHMANEAMKLAKLENVTCKVYDEKFLKKEKMNSFLAVNRASVYPPRLIHLTYKPKDAKKRVIFVGKGLTYDSGGLSLKPSQAMVSMKADKSGAAAVLGIIDAVAKLKLPLEVHGIIGSTENMIGGDAYKPDDVLKSRNGITIEVKNTDAEGRLVLCDCLDYAQDFKPDYMVDLATLTGACVVALGEYTSGILGVNEQLQKEFYEASKRSGELTTPLYSNRYLEKSLKSNVADICNISNSRYGGAITAGIFLSRFVKDKYKDSWLHLDIAGPAFIDKPWGYAQSGASGAGVRMCISWLRTLMTKEK